jgi:hypothetical protein
MITPKFYFCRGGASDRKDIEKCMVHIPSDKQQQVSDEYERRYLMNGHVNVSEAREEANKWLGDVACKYKDERSPDALQRHLDNMKEMVGKGGSEGKTPTSSGVIDSGKMPEEYKGKILRDAGL